MSDDAATEVLGQVLAFGTVAALLVVAILAQSLLSAQAEEKQAASEAGQVASIVADAVRTVGLRAEGGTIEDLQIRIDLPERLAGAVYEVRLEADAVRVDAGGTVARAPLYNIGATPTVDVCVTGAGATAAGGPVLVRFVAAGGPPPCSTDSIILEEQS